MDDIKYLNETVWATVKPSPIAGVGVFAIRDIKKGTAITDHSIHNIRDVHCLSIPVEDFEKIDESIRFLILDRMCFKARTKTFKFYSPNAEICLQSFMNHSDDANSDGRYALRDIMRGEEVTEDFKKLESDLHPIVKAHYKFL